jgi:hypothetical protein
MAHAAATATHHSTDDRTFGRLVRHLLTRLSLLASSRRYHPERHYMRG